MRLASYIKVACTLLLFAPLICLSQNEVQRVRINFETPVGFVRHLLLGFTPDDAATDGFDYGYDAPNIEDHPDDMNWMIENNRYVIQGVGSFDTSKAYPLGIFLTNSGTVNISLMSLENFVEPINVYIYDVNNASYHQINDAPFNFDLNEGEYIDDYFITFSTNAVINGTLSISETSSDPFLIRYLEHQNSLKIQAESNSLITKVEIYNQLGQLLTKVDKVNQNTVVLPINNYAVQPFLVRIESGQKNYVKQILPN